MNKKQKAEEIQKILGKYFPNPKIPLNYKDNFTFLIAVILSAQCRDERVNQITKKLFSSADTPEKMRSLSVSEIEKIIRPCGLSKIKAKSLHSLSEILLKKYEGKVPSTYKELISLPSVGNKTASVLLSHSFNKAAFPVDTHIFRCAHRWGLSKEKNIKKTEEDLKKLFPKKSWKKLHLQIIAYAKKFCPARGHKIENCEICSFIKSR
jgi:endonuclease-3